MSRTEPIYPDPEAKLWKGYSEFMVRCADCLMGWLYCSNDPNWQEAVQCPFCKGKTVTESTEKN